jgi:hypothetical protein
MSQDRPVIEAISSLSNEFPSRSRSAVTNHLPGLDGRSATARRFRDLVNALIADMGGLDRCSEIRLGLLRRLASTTVQARPHKILAFAPVWRITPGLAIFATIAVETIRA